MMKNMYLAGAVFILTLGSNACGPPPASESLKGIDEACEMYCDTLFYCPYRQVPGETEDELRARADHCTEICSSDAEESAAIGALCAESYSGAIMCFSELSCDQHRLHGTPDEYPCEASEDAAFADCLGLWGNQDR